jgi:hypothetical protein
MIHLHLEWEDSEFISPYYFENLKALKLNKIYSINEIKFRST